MFMSKLVFLVISTLLICTEIFAQSPEFYNEIDYNSSKLFFNYEVFHKPTLDKKNIIEIITKTDYKRLVFVEFENEFRATVDITIEFKNRRKRVMASESWTEIIRTKELPQLSNKELYHIAKKEIEVPKGKYSLVIEFEEKNSERSYTSKSAIEIKNKRKGDFSLSNIIIVENLKLENDNIVDYTPSVLDQIQLDNNSTYYTYLELLSSEPNNVFNVEVELKYFYLRKSESIIATSFDLRPIENKLPIIFNITDNKLRSGRYNIKYIITSSNGFKKEISKEFFISMFGEPKNEQDLDFSLNLMKKVFNVVKFKGIRFRDREIWNTRIAFARTDSIKIYKSPYPLKLRIYNSIWKSLDPTPSTDLNEARRVFLRRVVYSNEYFGTSQEGWKTDMGMLFIIFGAPDKITRVDTGDRANDRRRYSYPIQYWEYIQNGLIFQFVDKHHTNKFEFDRQIR